ncbi:MAG: hypothetical protein LAP38_01220 [Acidobacteriia bacterium]|nr:hypothetical protein [Terriglobia bacterium]
MKKAQSVALIGAGKLTDSSLARFWALSELLGPVKASSFRLASRIANRLRAGYPVKDCSEFDACRLILICVPDRSVKGVVAELCSAPIHWPRKAVVLCSTWLDSMELRPLAARGASVGSLSTIPGFDDTRYLVEGDRLAVLESRRLVEHGERRAVAIERQLKPLFLTALTCTGSLLVPLLMAASESLRHAGVPSAASAAILEKQLSQSLRSYVRGGRRAYQEPRELPRQLRALSIADPPLASYIEQSCRLAARLLEARQPLAEKHYSAAQLA